MSKIINIPKLRFKEFSGVWEDKLIGQILTVGSGKDYKHLSNGDIPVYGTGGYMLSVNDYLYDGESVGIGRKGTIDKPIFLTGKFWTVDTLFYTHSFKNSVPKFIYSIFQRINWKLYNEASGVPSLSKSTIEKIKIFIPSKHEQEKIASFLISIDTRIEQLTKKEELLQQYKKGVMQKIFNQEIRFKADDGSEFCEWEEKKLGDLLDYIQPTKYLVKGTEYNDSYIIPVLTAGKTFILGYTNETDGVFENNLPVIIFDDFTTANKFVNFPFKAKSSAMKILVPKNNNNIKFIYEAMQMIKYEVGGHERHWISKFSFLNIFIPCIEEQTKIANFLSSIDSKIEQVQKQLNFTKEFKKALLQQMFV